MCVCEAELAHQFLPHQTKRGTEYGTRKRYPVAGFATGLCPSCRGEVEKPHPMAAVRGRKSKIERFYWREITKTYHAFAHDWLAENKEQVRDIIEFQNRFPEISAELRKQARAYWQKAHRAEPKYDLSEPTQEALHGDVDIPQTIVRATYAQVMRANQKIGKWQNSEGEFVSAEAVAKEFYLSQEWQAYVCERKLISTLYGTFCFTVVQDADDPRIVVGQRGSTRGWTTANRNTKLISIPLPQDFGTPEHFNRRAAEYARLFDFLRGESLPDLFERWLEPSENLRDYLWVNDDSAVALARTVVQAVSNVEILKWLEWVARDFWQRQPGWPDLFLARESGFRFAEVKSPHDELSQEQMRWFRWAVGEANIPCEICRIKKGQAFSDTTII